MLLTPMSYFDDKDDFNTGNVSCVEHGFQMYESWIIWFKSKHLKGRLGPRMLTCVTLFLQE